MWDMGRRQADSVIEKGRMESEGRQSRTIVRIIARLNVGGPAQQAAWLSARLAPMWRTVLVVGRLAPGEADMSDIARRCGVEPVMIPQLGRSIRPWDDLVALVAIARLLWRERPALVHTHTAKAGALGRAAAWWYNLWHPSRRCRVVHTFHGHVFAGYFNRWMTRWFIWTERWLAVRTDRIIAVSERVRCEVLALGIGRPERVVVVPLGLELDPFLRGQGTRDKGQEAEGRRQKAAVCGQKPVTIGIVGRLVPVKNHRLFLDAAAHLVPRPPSPVPRFLVVGDGELREDLVRYAQSIGLNGAVQFFGWRRDLPQLYGEIDIVALTSWNEGSPVSLIEAMASGCPIVATDVGGVRELLEGMSHVACRTSQEVVVAGRKTQDAEGKAHDLRLTTYDRSSTTCDLRSATGYEMLPHGLLVPPGDAQAFAAALQRLSEDAPLRYGMGEAGRRFVTERFCLDRLVTDIEQLYHELLGTMKVGHKIQDARLKENRDRQDAHPAVSVLEA